MSKATEQEHLPLPKLVPRWWRLLRPRERRQLKWSFVPSILVAIAETGAVAMLLPLITLLSGEGPVPDDGWLGLLARIGQTHNRSALAGRLSVFIFAVFVTKAIAAVFFSRWQFGILARADAEASWRLFDRYMRAPYPRFLLRNTADLAYQVRQMTSYCFMALGGALLNLLVDAVTTVLILGLLLALQPVAALAMAAVFALGGVVYISIVGPWVRRAGREDMEANVAFSRLLQESLQGFKVVRAHDAEAATVRRYRDVRVPYARLKRDLMVAAQLPRYFLELLLVLTIAAVTLVSLHSGAEGAIQALGLFVGAGLRLLPSLNRLLVSLSMIHTHSYTVLTFERELALAEGEVLTTEEKDRTPLAFERELRLNGVSFTYPATDTEAVSDISFTIEWGTSVGIVGGSGAGKSTLVDLILGLLPPSRGTISVDGTTLDSTTLSRWRHNVGYVPQDIFLFDASIAENVAIRIEADEIDEDRLRRAISLAQLDDLVASLPDGLASKVGERGVRLSGGQRQRIGIARALYDEPAVLLLDEATSALDTVTEAHLVETVHSFHGNLTTILVAHRLSTVRSADVIHLLGGGRLLASGSFDELFETSEAFRALAVNAGMTPSVD